MTQHQPPAQATPQDGKVVLDALQLKALRKQRGLSQDGLAQLCMQSRLCVSIASVKRAESGRPVLYRTASHLARAFARPLDEIVAFPAAPGDSAWRMPAPAYVALAARHIELQQFKATIDSARAHLLGHILYVRGAAGTGKSRLLAQFAHIAGQRGLECHGAVVSACAPEQPLAALGHLVRALLLPPHHVSAPNPADALRELIRRRARARPLLLMLEDIHAGGAELIGALAALLRDVQETPVVWVLSARAEQDPCADALRASVNGLPMTVLDLGALRRHDMLALLRSGCSEAPV